jgi:uncharacterized protein (DUF427 family)
VPSDVPQWLKAARDQWRWQGHERPPFAAVPGAGQESVWDYPRPPAIVADSREVVIQWGPIEVARTRHSVRVLETAHPPCFYLPFADVRVEFLKTARGSSFCEWKGPASYWSLIDGDRQLPRVAWSYPKPLPGAEAISDRVAFYPSELDCRVDGARVRAQPGGFYGGWITPELVGPFKGERGSEGW